MRAGREGQFDEEELQVVYRLRAERDQEKQWLLAEAQQGLVQMGSPMTVADLAAAGQRAADKLTCEQYARMEKEAEDTMNMIALEKQKHADHEYARKTLQKGANKRAADLAAMQRGMKAGKQTKKSLENHPYKKTGSQ